METKKQQSNFLLNQGNTKKNQLSIKKNGTSIWLLLVLFLLTVFPLCPLAASINASKIFQLQQQLISNPRDVDAHLHLAMEYSLANDFVRAVETYFALLRIDENNFHAYNNLGILYKKSGQFRDSLHCYSKAEKINPDSYWVPYNMGLCYEAMGRMQEARESYGRALSLNPSFNQALQRLRALADGGSSQPMPRLPGLEESQVYLVDSQTGKPRIYSSAPAAEPKSDKEPVRAEPARQLPPQKPEKISEKLLKAKEEKVKHRTTRKSPASAIFNQAMDALDENKLERAIELYASCIIAERDFLAEPDNGLIRKGLEFLKDRPNRMPNGQFYRGLLIYISGNLELAVPDMTAFIEQNSGPGKKKNSEFMTEAQRIIDQQAAVVAMLENQEKERAELLAAAEAARLAGDSQEEEEQARASDFVIKRMTVDQIIAEADRLSRESRPQDAAAVLETGLKTEPDDLRLLMKCANAYTDMMLLKGDQEAGKMALMRFEKAYSIAPANSREWGVAQEMIQELKKRVR